jgi:RNA polymerase sigma factor (sigma-70 family)
MMLNEYLSWRRRSARQVPVDTGTLEPASAASDHAQQYIERSALLAELGKLSRRQRAVLVLRYHEDRGDAEIAELLGCTPGTVRGVAVDRAASARYVGAR